MGVDTFERQQLWKEHTHPVILRQSALKSAFEYCTMHGLQLKLEDLMLLTERFFTFYETGNEDWILKAQTYLDTKKSPTVETAGHNLT